MVSNLKKRTFVLIFILLFVLSLLSLFNRTQYVNAGVNDLEYIFENDDIFNESMPFSNSTFNLRDSYEYTQEYNATYSFTNDENGENPSGWIITENGNSFVNVINEKHKHNKVVEMYYDSGVPIMKNDWIDDIMYGTFEWWMESTDCTNKILVYIRHDVANAPISLFLHVDKWQYIDNTGTKDVPNVPIPIDNEWMYIKIHFETTVGAYMGLSQYKWKIIINGIDSGELNLRNNEPMDEFYTQLETDDDYSVFYDGIGYSWDTFYNVNDNIVPIIDYSNSNQEINKCEFAYNITTIEPNKTEYPTINNEWIETDFDNEHIKTGIESEGEISIDYLNDHTHQFGIEKEFNYNNNGIYNVSLTTYMANLYLDTKGFNFNIYTYDDTLLVRLRIALDNPITKVYYYDGSSYVYLYSVDDGYFNDLIFNIYIDSFCILELIEVSESINTYYFPKLTNKIGINTIEFIGDVLASSTMDIYIKSIGFYINGSSYLPHDLSSLTINTNIDNWNDDIHNLFYITANGTFSLSVEYDEVIEAIIFPLTFFNNEMKVFHYVESEIFQGSQPYTFLILTNTTYQINTIQVSQVILTEDTNEYFMEFEFEGINANESYFYVSSNRLYFTLNVISNDTLEYIRANFNVENVYSSDRSISFHSDFNGDSLGIFGLDYLGGKSRFFLFPNYPAYKNVILHQGKTLDNFSITITDNNYNETYGISTGYIYNIKLIYVPDIEVTLLTTTLIRMLIPLMIILIPTIAIYIEFGKDLVIPMLILMSLICYVTNLIPIEVFFIIMLSCGVFIVENYRGRERY